jgi:hypothetical protein
MLWPRENRLAYRSTYYCRATISTQFVVRINGLYQ